MKRQCVKCGSRAVRLLELLPAGASEYGCLGCGAIVPPKGSYDLVQIVRQRAVTPHRPPDWESEAAKIARLRALRLGQATKPSRQVPI
jgi:hypothetical protein